jgi:hypothetical protein
VPQEYVHFLDQVTWQEVCVGTYVNAEFSTMLDKSHFHCGNACPLKTIYLRGINYEKLEKNWVTRGITDSTQFKIKYMF